MMWQRLCMITAMLVMWMAVALLNLAPWIAVVASLVWLGCYVALRMRQERQRAAASAALERALLPEAAAASGQAEAKFRAALQDIKQRGMVSAPLVNLPVYVALGASQSGVRSLLAHAGLRWRGREIKPVMGCQWWLDDTCIVVRPTGVDPRSTRVCMDALRRYRRPAPVDGVLITLSLGDLLELPEAQLKRNADDLRAQLESLQDPLHARAPVYLVVTQADRLPGFVATFAKVTPQHRQDVWGDSFHVRADEQHAQEALGSMLDSMVQQTAAQTLHHMQMSSDVDAREQIYQFPERLAALRGPLLTWSNAFFATIHRRANPRLRGAYVCSATPKESMAFHASLPGQASQAMGAPFFTSNLVSTGMLPDAGRPTAVGVSSEMPRARIATLAASVLLVALPLVCYIGNYLQFAAARQQVEALVEEGKAAEGKPASLHSMEALTEMLAEMDKDSQQATYLNAHTGMSPGVELVPKLRRLYLASVRDRIVTPLLAADMQHLKALLARYHAPTGGAGVGTLKRPPPADRPAREIDDDSEDDDDDDTSAPDEQEYAAAFNMLKTHLMCSAEGQEPFLQDARDSGWLVETLARRWGQEAGEGSDQTPGGDNLQRHVAAYVDAVRADPGLRVTRETKLVADVRETLMRTPEEVAVIAMLTEGVETYTLALPDLLGDVQAPVHSDRKIRGAYTRAGWENVVRARMAQNSGEREDMWVLGSDGASRRRAFLEASSTDMRDFIYWHNYANAWHAFVISLRLPQPPGAPSRGRHGDHPGHHGVGDHGSHDGRDDHDDAGDDEEEDLDAAASGKTPGQRLAAEYPVAYQRLLQAVKYNLEPVPHQDMQPSASDL